MDIASKICSNQWNDKCRHTINYRRTLRQNKIQEVLMRDRVQINQGAEITKVRIKVPMKAMKMMMIMFIRNKIKSNRMKQKFKK